MKTISIMLLFVCGISFSICAQTKTIRPGKHLITLQWIGVEKPGVVMITEKVNGIYSIKGKQENASGDMVSIEGSIWVINAKELKFDGNILSQVSFINGGKPCLREGVQTFKATGTRKYWRLQKMINCEGGMVTDYIDIYF